MAHALNDHHPAAMAHTGAPGVAHTGAVIPSHDLHAIKQDWQSLLTRACEPSVYANPGWLLPMLEHASSGSEPVVITTSCPAANRLTGVYPFIRKTTRWLFPVPILTSWDNDFFFSGLPLAPASATQASMSAMLHTAGRDTGAKAILFRNLPDNGPFARALKETVVDLNLPIMQLDPFERAGLIAGRNFDAWFQESFQRKKRKEFRRLRNRLSEQGNLELITHKPADPIRSWVDDFTKLENAGWKGRSGTAIACADHMVDFLNTALAQLDETEDLMAWKLCLDGKPIAMLFAMLSGNRAWLGKIAYDEAFARFSPGVLLVLDATADVLARGDIEQVDSSAIPDHPMINHIWRDRLAMTDIMVATPGTPSWAFALMTTAEQARRKARATAKTAYQRFLKGKAK